MSTAVSIVIGIVMLSILVVVHEFGHFLLARKNGIFVKEFAIGFGPKIFSKESKSGTVFAWKAVPFGGSCTMLGMLEDEDDNTDDERSFDKKSVWARMSVTLAGPVFNFILALVMAIIYIAVMGYDPATVTSVEEGSPAYEAGLREGDVITSYDGAGISFGREIYLENYLKPVSERTDGVDITYVRDGESYSITVIPVEYEYYLMGLSYYSNSEPAEISGITEGSACSEAGMEDGDIITEINGVSISTGEELGNYFDDNPVDGTPINVTYTRRGGTHETVVTPLANTSYKLGFSYNLKNVRTDALGTLKYSFAELKYEIVSVYKSLGLLFSDQGSLDMLSGPVGIVEVISDTYTATSSYGFKYTLMSMISLLLMLSANLGVMNLLPIPALDGGKFVLEIIEVIIRKPVPKKVETVVTVVGAALLVILMFVVLANDIIKLF